MKYIMGLIDNLFKKNRANDTEMKAPAVQKAEAAKADQDTLKPCDVCCEDNKTIFSESMHREALFRLDSLIEKLEISKYIRINFANGRIYCSTKTPNGFADCTELDRLDDYSKAVKLYEKNTGCMVYYVIANGTQPYLLTVHPDETRWAEERPDGNKMDICVYDMEKEEYHRERAILYSDDGFIYVKAIKADDQLRGFVYRTSQFDHSEKGLNEGDETR